MQKILLYLIFSFSIPAILCTYSPELAKTMFHFSSISYQSQPNIDAWNCEECKEYKVNNQKSFFSNVGNIQGYAAYYPSSNAIVVAFRGTVDIKNWLLNLNSIKIKYPGCQGCEVHLGFWGAFQGVAPMARALVEKLLGLYHGAKLIATGHSLGGTMATLFALDLKMKYGNVDDVYTFGQPRIGNRQFSNYVTK
jgi:predicted lipase